MLAAIGHGVVVVVVGAALGWWIGGRWGALVAAAVSSVLGWRYARVLMQCRPYPPDRRGRVLAVLDATWSAPNTLAAAAFASALSLRGNPCQPERSAGVGLVHFRDAGIPGYATTVGIVTANCSARVEAHERVHVLQARLFGPLYLPLVGVGFVVAIVVPYWLVSRAARARVHDVRSYFVRGVYPHTWHEWWAYRVAPTRPRPT